MYKEMYLPEFLEIHYKQIGKIVEFSPYMAFGLICAGIELLGKCFDKRITGFNHYVPKYQFNVLPPRHYNFVQCRIQKTGPDLNIFYLF